MKNSLKSLLTKLEKTQPHNNKHINIETDGGGVQTPQTKIDQSWLYFNQ